MPRKGKSVVSKAGGAIARTARKLTSKLDPRKRSAKKAEAARKKIAKPKTASARATTPRSDVALDLIASTYSPKQTSLKTSFRSNGSDQQLDQEMPIGAADRWQDEDHFTNKSGDARIGTHGRNYEPGEKRASSANDNRRR
ncbi:MAG TPA: hypothetical protein VHY33_04875 [Thermoanaerobaculia bacterium]|jgi:hypothetical protein|nr:hypothetical protein [Thermoanaerobaculia bacterium]